MSTKPNSEADVIHRMSSLGTPPFLPTKDFSKLFNIEPQTARKNFCLNGHCYGIVPKKMPNKTLGWPTDQTVKALYSDQEAA